MSFVPSIRMCITEVWTYYECGCQYLHPIPCYERFLGSSGNVYQTSGSWTSASHSSSSSLSSSVDQRSSEKANDSHTWSSSQTDGPRPEDEMDAAYNHRLRLVRTCSLRRTVERTFLEPICDDCLLLELGLAQEMHGPPRRKNGDKHGQGNLHGAEWLLESNVEISVEEPAIENDGFATHSGPSVLCSSSEADSGDETPRRGRGRRRAMEIRRTSQAIHEGSSLRGRRSSQRLQKTGQSLRRARKRHDLQRSSTTGAGLSELPSARRSSWIEHLRSDLGQRIRKKRPDVDRGADATHNADSSHYASSGTSEDDRFPSLPSIPTTASSTFSTASGSMGAEEPIMLTLNQIILSSEFDSSHLSNTYPSGATPEDLQLGREEPTGHSTSSSRSVRSFNPSTLTILPCSGPVTELAGSTGDISFHPLSCPLPTSRHIKERIVGEEGQKDREDNNGDRQGNSGGR